MQQVKQAWQKAHLAAPRTPDGTPMQKGKSREGRCMDWLPRSTETLPEHMQRELKAKLQWSWNLWDGKGNRKGL